MTEDRGEAKDRVYLQLSRESRDPRFVRISPATISLGVVRKVWSVKVLALEKIEGVKLVAVMEESRFLRLLDSGMGGAIISGAEHNLAAALAMLSLSCSSILRTTAA